MEEIILPGGRMTPGVVRIGDLVHRPMGINAPFVHEVLTFLEQEGISFVPQLRGIDLKNREMFTFIEGEVPADLGTFTTQQCCQAVYLIKKLHRCLWAFPGCPSGQTICHNDLSPCNFVFLKGMPIAIIDWDAAAFGDPLDDLAYALWMWLDIGNEDNDPLTVQIRINALLDAYGLSSADRLGFEKRILMQMERVGKGVFPTEEQSKATALWTQQCQLWVKKHLKLCD